MISVSPGEGGTALRIRPSSFSAVRDPSRHDLLLRFGFANHLRIMAVLLVIPCHVWADEPDAVGADGTERSSVSSLSESVDAAVSGLVAGSKQERERAEERLLELADTAGDFSEYLSLLPSPAPSMPAEMRDRLLRVRRQIESRFAAKIGDATLISLAAEKRSLSEVFKIITEQTGNEIVDSREGMGNSFDSIKIDLGFEEEAFWPALDRILDVTSMDVYNFAGSEAIALTARERGALARYQRGTYSGPFRLEIFEVGARRNLRRMNEQQLRLSLEVAWEPRLLPIAISQGASDIRAIDDSGNRVPVFNPSATLSVEAVPGNQAAELSIPLVLPDRSVTKLSSLTGTLRALVPGRRGAFRFENIEETVSGKPRRQRQGGAEVALAELRRNGSIWEIHMRLRLDEAAGALESHRGWVFHNQSYLETADGKIINDVGLETAFQGANEVGLVYLYPVEDDARDITWVYEAPTSILNLAVEYELTDIPLP